MNNDKNRPYKPTGNLAVDMVAACINHHDMFGKKLYVIRLDAIHWTMFKGFVMEKIPAFTVLDNEIDFDGVIVTQSNILQSQVMSWELAKEPVGGLKIVN